MHLMYENSILLTGLQIIIRLIKYLDFLSIWVKFYTKYLLSFAKKSDQLLQNCNRSLMESIINLLHYPSTLSIEVSANNNINIMPDILI